MTFPVVSTWVHLIQLLRREPQDGPKGSRRHQRRIMLDSRNCVHGYAAEAEYFGGHRKRCVCHSFSNPTCSWLLLFSSRFPRPLLSKNIYLHRIQSCSKMNLAGLPSWVIDSSKISTLQASSWQRLG